MIKRFTFIISVFLTLYLASFLAKQINFDNSKWLSQDNKIEQNKNFVEENFTPNKNLIVIIKLKESLINYIEEINSLSKDLEKNSNIIEAQTVFSTQNIINDKKSIKITNLYDAYKKGSIKKQELEEKIKNSIYYKNLVSTDWRNFLIIIKHQIPKENIFQFRSDLVNFSNEILKKYSFYQDYNFSGESFLNYKIDKDNLEDLQLLLILAFLVAVLLLLLIYRDFFRVVLLFTSSSLCLVFCFLVFYLYQENFTIINIILPILIIVIALSDSIFITSRADLLMTKHQQKKNIIINLIKQTWLPCFLTSITTAISFFSFYFSEIIPLKKLGLIAPPIILGSYIIIVTSNWLAIYYFLANYKLSIRHYKISNKILGKIIDRINKFDKFYDKKILLIALIMMIVSASFLWTKFYTETNFLKIFFKNDSRIVQGYKNLDNNFNGSGTVNLILQNESFTQIETFNQLKKLKYKLQSSNVKDINSYHNVISMIHKSFKKEELYPQNSSALEQELLFISFSKSETKQDLIEPYLDFSYKNTRFEIKTKNLSSLEIEKLIKELKIILKENKQEKYILAGNNVYFHHLNKYILDTQLRSILITFFIITLLMFIFFNYKIALFSIIINFLPVLVTLSIIAFLNIPFDFSTILIATISFGVIIDSSIHLLHIYSFLEHDKKLSQHIRENSMKLIARPIIISATTFSLIFLIFVFSDLIILIKFGFFCFLAIILSLITNLLLLPAIMRYFKLSD